ncbi:MULTISPECIES: DUF441 domain-containing protein [Desulfofundulus]|jgi:uncharacterized membrane protein (DUF441 family)|uniref:UPF0756 membrane protein SAMN02745218_02853 n=1 Tax=Desulfofundulus australicus DSM 11792 TaxID=1121425 RepID=A0A1M5DKY0_9FIRM|nr:MULTISPECIES: DUF441 domain-containing protein [Desulfofundulus]MBE3586442.1 DUF441 domain-containing protein [Thermoanaerobacter sp.]MCS5696753.1 DUF441 domain-containing protein [Desulfofundulus thermocisternus]MDK2888708.1 hypothetical protein [Thermoanaerobacter sp.]SHF67555.1 Uncharacterized membrane protein, DUF441 family [Desulfofundulus australicus DSM 11792]
MPGFTLLVALFLIGVIARSNLIATAACLLLIIKLAKLNFIFPFLEKRGLELGLLFLLLSILVPVATGRITEREMLYNLTSLPGLLALFGGALATHLNGEGLRLLQLQPEIIFGLVTGSIIGIVFLGGVPVGPLMAAGITALFMELASWLKN